MTEHWHGRLVGYNHHRCRCDRCCEAMSDYKKAYRAGPGAEVERAYRREQHSRGRETENARRKELKLRQQWGEVPVSTVPFYRFLAEAGQTF